MLLINQHTSMRLPRDVFGAVSQLGRQASERASKQKTRATDITNGCVSFDSCLVVAL